MKFIKQMPERKIINIEQDCGYDYEYQHGFNDCLDQIKAQEVEMSVEKLIELLKSREYCNISHLDTDWCELVNVVDLAEQLAQAINEGKCFKDKENKDESL